MAKGRKRPLPDIRIRIGISVLVAVIVFLLTYKRAFYVLNNQLSNSVYQTESVSSLPITIVKIDEKTINELGQPIVWSRQVYADLINKLNAGEYKPSVIAFDILFTGNKDSEGDKAFADAAARYGNVVTGINASFSEHGDGREKLTLDTLVHIDSITMPYEELEANAFCGLTNCEPDKYDYITTAYTGLWYNDKWYDCLAVQTLKRFCEYVKSNERYAENHPDYANIIIPDFPSQPVNRYRFSYAEGPGGFDSVSLVDILNGSFPAESLANNIILVGMYASGYQDDFKILFSDESRMYGVEIHANIMEAVFEGRLQTDANQTALALIYALVSALLCFAMLSVNIIKGVIMAVGTFVLYMVVSFIIYRNGIYIMLLYMIMPVVLLMIGMVVYHYISARSERVKINKAFRMYVAPEIVDDVAGSGTYELQLGGRNKDIAVLFVDIRGFTTMSENLEPKEVVDILNEYFGVITDAIFKNKGTLDKFIGDAAMAVFNSPFDLDDYVYRAVMTACDIAKASEALGDKLMERFGKKVSYGIGVNCGDAIIGNIGSNFRMDYTAIGDTVNTASRLESNAKAGEILISEEVKKRLGDRIETEDVGEIPLKGKHNKIFVYRVKLT
ncbi:MAG: adenylate/guanylate cyclase domain-containing protein [Lachnospiraceae bacterium]|nr:adenylate/guanylate cyclase domain-containing protein [Lachnospiraceae bacterium]